MHAILDQDPLILVPFIQPTSLPAFVISIPYASISTILTRLLLGILVRPQRYKSRLGGNTLMQRLMNTFPPFVERFHELDVYSVEHSMVCGNSLGPEMLVPKLPLYAPGFTVRSERGCGIESYAVTGMVGNIKNSRRSRGGGEYLHFPSHHLPSTIRIYRRPPHEQILDRFQSVQYDQISTRHCQSHNVPCNHKAP